MPCSRSREFGDASGMTECVRRLDISKIGNGSAGSIELLI